MTACVVVTPASFLDDVDDDDPPPPAEVESVDVVGLLRRGRVCEDVDASVMMPARLNNVLFYFFFALASLLRRSHTYAVLHNERLAAASGCTFTAPNSYSVVGQKDLTPLVIPNSHSLVRPSVRLSVHEEKAILHAKCAPTAARRQEQDAGQAPCFCPALRQISRPAGSIMLPL